VSSVTSVAKPIFLSENSQAQHMNKRSYSSGFLLALALLIPCALAHADESISISGNLTARAVDAFDRDSATEDPGLEGRLKLDSVNADWRFYSWLEGEWDGAVKRPPRDHALIKSFDRVYQSDSPYLEFKELYVEHSAGVLDVRAGIQRFAWGRLDEYPLNDLLNPWDYTQFLRKSLEDRKIGVPSISGSVNTADWITEVAWVPVFIPYRLPLPDERWSGISTASALQQVPNAEVNPTEPTLPARTIENSSLAIRLKHAGDIEWTLNAFHGIDPRPVFRTTALTILPQGSKIDIDPGYMPDFHKLTVLGIDAATVRGDLSIRMEAAYSYGRYLNIRRELWGYPSVPVPGINPLNPDIEQKHDTIDYGVGADYRLFEEATLTMQAQQTLTLGAIDSLYEARIETILWASVKMGFMNQKIDTNIGIAYNPEHADWMTKATVWYQFNDSWKAGVNAVDLTGPDQSLFGKYARNDQAEAEMVYSW
jgi:hypothetical protein